MRTDEKPTSVALAEPPANESVPDRLLDSPSADGANDGAVRDGLLYTGTIVGVDREDGVLVVVGGRAAPLRSRALAHISPGDIGKAVVLGFEGGVLERPMVIGVLGASPFEDEAESGEITINAERLALEGKTEVVIRCGPTSITLTQAGKVLIKGEYVSSRATGTHRIRGGSVQIN